LKVILITEPWKCFAKFFLEFAGPFHESILCSCQDAGIVQLFLRCREDADNRPSATDIVVDFPLKLKKLEAMSQVGNSFSYFSLI